MVVVVLFFAVFMMAVGLVGLAAPATLLGYVRIWQRRSAVWITAAIRVVLGVALIAVAPESKAPTAFLILGAVAVLAGVVTPLVRQETVLRLIEWWEGRPPALVRAWCAFVVGLGGLLLYGIAP